MNPFLSFMKLKYKWIKDLQIKPDTVKLIGEKVGKTLEDMGTGENFLDRIPFIIGLFGSLEPNFLSSL